MNTVVAELTATSGSVHMTSTAVALTATSTPTSAGDPTSTPNNLDLTATSIVQTTVPQEAVWPATVTGSPTLVSVDAEVPVPSQKSAGFLGGTGFLWILSAGLIVLFTLVYMLGKELKK